MVVLMLTTALDATLQACLDVTYISMPFTSLCQWTRQHAVQAGQSAPLRGFVDSRPAQVKGEAHPVPRRQAAAVVLRLTPLCDIPAVQLCAVHTCSHSAIHSPGLTTSDVKLTEACCRMHRARCERAILLRLALCILLGRRSGLRAAVRNRAV